MDDENPCGHCHEHPRHGRSYMCLHCLADNAARSAETKARLGILSGHQILSGGRRKAPVLRCRDCGDVVDRAHASWHAWTCHRKAVPHEELEVRFAAVAS